MVDIALAGEVVVQAQQVWRAAGLLKKGQLLTANARLHELRPPLVLTVHAAAQQVKAQPAPAVFVVNLRLQRRRAKGFAQVFGLHQLGLRRDAAYGLHGQHHRAALVHQQAQKAGFALAVRVPVAVEPRKACRGQRLVDGGEVNQPGVALRHALGVAGQHRGKFGLVHGGVHRAAAVVHEAGNRGDAQRPQAGQALVVPAPVAVVGVQRRHGLQQHGVAQRAYA